MSNDHEKQIRRLTDKLKIAKTGCINILNAIDDEQSMDKIKRIKNLEGDKVSLIFRVNEHKRDIAGLKDEIQNLKDEVKAAQLAFDVLLKKEKPERVEIIDDIGCSHLEEGKEYDVHGEYKDYYYLVSGGNIEVILNSQCKPV